MSAKGGSNGGKGSTGISAIPAGSRKMVQSLKEIVNNCTEQEIYAMLKECNMDPNETVNRLLAQDPFHEVKSKREKKKESKDVTDTRPRGSSNSLSRGGKGGGDRYGGRTGSSQFGSNESAAFHGKPAYKKENGSTSSSVMAGNNLGRRPATYSDPLPAESKAWSAGGGDIISSSPQPVSGFQSSWMGVPGQVSMADIVKMGRPSRVSTATNPNVQPVPVPSSAVSHQNFQFAQDHGSKETELERSRDFASNRDWPSIEQPQATILEAPANSELYAGSSQQLDETEVDGDTINETHHANPVGSASVSGRTVQEDDSRGATVFDDNLYNDMSSYQAHGHNAYEHIKEEPAANLQQLSLQEEDHDEQSEEDVPAVVIPDHLQLHTPDCLHLSFGSFGSNTNAASSGAGTFGARPGKEETSASVDVDARNAEYYGDEHIRTASDGNLIHRTGPSADEYDSPSVSQEEALKQETAEPDQEHSYTFPSGAPGFSYESAQQLNAAFNHQQTASQMQNLAPFSSVMQAYTNSLPNHLLASNAQTVRDELPYSPFPVTQSMAGKYSNPASSINAPNMSMPEALRAASNISAPQPTQQTMTGGNVGTGPALPQHLAVHPYSQPTLPFANMISYPFLHQSYTYMPSAFQQAFAGNSTYHQNLAAVLPPYKNNVSVPQPAAASGYGFGSSTSVPGGNFPVNTPAAPSGTTIGYDDMLSSQYKEASHLMSLQQQNENSAMWLHGPGSRAMPAVPGNTYYGFQGQNQQHGGFRQGQQGSQQFGTVSYNNFYHSPSAMSLEHQQQQQNARDAALGAQPSKQAQQLWQSY